MISRLIVCTALVGMTTAVLAQSAAPAAGASMPRVEKRQAHQQARIAQGAASGQLTPKETQRLQAQQNRIETAETRAQADGKVTTKERAALKARQDKASHNIAHQKHDKQTAPAQP